MIHAWGREGLPEALLLHCSLAHGRAFAGMAKHLGEGLHLRAPDLLGHGEAEDPDPARPYHDQATEAVAGLLPASGGVVIGHSFGATIALRLAIENPDRVARLVLIEPVLFAAAGDGPGRRAVAEGVGPLEPLIDAGERATALRNFLAFWGDEAPERMRPATRAYMEERMHLIPMQNPWLDDDQAGLLPRLGAVRVSVLLLEGALSPPVVPEIMEALARDLPDARRVVIQGAGHMVPITHPGEVAHAILAFIES